MGMMARMRSLAPWFIITVGGLFVIFMIFSDTRMGGLFGKNEVVVGSIDGKDITAQEFSVTVDNLIKQQEAQTGKKIEEDQLDYFRDNVWNQLVASKLIEKKIKEYGIVVSDDEVREVLLGPNPPAELAQGFTDSTGRFDRVAYESALRDPKYKAQVIQYENYIKTNLLNYKLQRYLTASINVSEDEMRRQYEDQNIKMKANFVLFDLNNVPDAEIKVTDDDLRNYYNKHMSDNKVDAQRKIKYVLFNKRATAQDSARIKENLIKSIAKLQKDTSSMKNLVGAYSDYPYSKDTLAVTAIPAEAKNLLFVAKPNDFVGPVAGPEGYIVYHLVARVKGKDPVVKVSHILIKSGSDDKAAKAKADDIYSQLQKGANFAELAKKYSEDGSASNGGDVGWGSKGSWVKEFEDAAFSGKVGALQKPVKSNFGYHIMKVTDRSDDRFVVEKIANKIQPSTTTTTKITRNANDLIKLAKSGDFQKEAEMMKYNVIETQPFTKKAGYINPIGYNPSLVAWAFDNNVGTVSERYFKTPAGFVVAFVSADIKAGVKTFEELKESIKSSVIREKKIEKMMQVAADAKSKLGGNNDLNSVPGFYPNVKADTTTEFSGSIQPNVGRDFAFIYYCKVNELNKVSNPVKGLRGAYLIKPTFRTQFSQSDYAAQRNAIRDRLIQSKRSQFFNQWLSALREETKIVDERYKYY